VRAEEGGMEPRFARGVREGCVNGLRVSLGSAEDLDMGGNCVAVVSGECRRERVTWRLRMRRPVRRLALSILR
jgi:hypothetical protein